MLPAITPPPALGDRIDGASPLTHNANNAATGGIWRVSGSRGTAILKVARPPAAESAEPVGSPAWQTSDVPTHWNYWRRESLAYRAGLAAMAYRDAGIVPPDLLDLAVQADGSVALWLADVAGIPGPQWSVAELTEFAHRLGAGQARWIDRVPDEPWLSRRWLAQYLADRRFWVPSDVDWAVPAAAVWPSRVRRALRELWDRRTDLVAVAESGPRTLCHLDVWPMNLIGSGGRTVLLDWAFVGEGAVGEDIANLVIDSVTDGLIDPNLLPEITDGAIEGYLSGLRDGGWTGSADDVRDAIAACGAAKYSWFAPAIVGLAARGSSVGSPSYGQHESNDAAFGRLTGLATLIADWSAL